MNCSADSAVYPKAWEDRARGLGFGGVTVTYLAKGRQDADLANTSTNSSVGSTICLPRHSDSRGYMRSVQRRVKGNNSIFLFHPRTEEGSSCERGLLGALESQGGFEDTRRRGSTEELEGLVSRRHVVTLLNSTAYSIEWLAKEVYHVDSKCSRPTAGGQQGDRQTNYSVS